GSPPCFFWGPRIGRQVLPERTQTRRQSGDAQQQAIPLVFLVEHLVPRASGGDRSRTRIGDSQHQDLFAGGPAPPNLRLESVDPLARPRRYRQDPGGNPRDQIALVPDADYL